MTNTGYVLLIMISVVNASYASEKTLLIQYKDDLFRFKVASNSTQTPELMKALIFNKFPSISNSTIIEYHDFDTGRFTPIFPKNVKKILHILISDINPDITLVPKITGKRFDLSEGLLIGNVLITLNEPNKANEGTGLTVWDGSVVLAKWLEKYPKYIMGKNVFEVGAGTGLAGIAASLLGATHVRYIIPFC